MIAGCEEVLRRGEAENCVNNKTFLINSIFRIKAAPNFIFDRGFPVSSQNKRREKLKITEKCMATRVAQINRGKDIHGKEAKKD